MQSSGRRQLSAPKCSAFTGVALNGITTSALTYNHGDSFISSSGGVSAGATSIVVADNTLVGDVNPFAAADTIYVGYGTALQEELTISSISSSATTIYVVGNVVNDHANGERVVVKIDEAPYRPGSVSLISGGSTVVATDDGAGTLATSGNVAAFSTGTVDYNTGTVTATFTTSASLTLTINGDTLVDTATADAVDGSGFQRNFEVLGLMTRDAPEFVVLTNLGDTEAGVLVEVSKDKGRHFESAPGVASAVLPPFARKMLAMPSGSGKSAVRIRCGAESTGASSIVDVDTIYDISNNGQ
jgi:hypothetical protein